MDDMPEPDDQFIWQLAQRRSSTGAPFFPAGSRKRDYPGGIVSTGRGFAGVDRTGAGS